MLLSYTRTPVHAQDALTHGRDNDDRAARLVRGARHGELASEPGWLSSASASAKVSTAARGQPGRPKPLLPSPRMRLCSILSSESAFPHSLLAHRRGWSGRTADCHSEVLRDITDCAGKGVGQKRTMMMHCTALHCTARHGTALVDVACKCGTFQQPEPAACRNVTFHLLTADKRVLEGSSRSHLHRFLYTICLM